MFIRKTAAITYMFFFNQLYKMYNKQELRFIRMQRDYHPFLFPTLYGYILKMLIEVGFIEASSVYIGKSCISIMIMTWVFNRHRRD